MDNIFYDLGHYKRRNMITIIRHSEFQIVLRRRNFNFNTALRCFYNYADAAIFFSLNQSLRSDGGKQGTNLLREKRNLMKLEMTTGKVQMAQSCTSHLSPLMI